MNIFAAIDFETANEKRNSACEVGFVKFTKNKIISSENYLIKPINNYFNPINYGKHKISWENVKNEKLFPEVWNKILPKLNNVEFIAAHNAKFDKSVLNACCSYYSIDTIRTKFVCTINDVVNVFWNNLPNKKLNTVCDYLNIPLDHHKAKSDSEACAKIVIKAFQNGWKLSI